MIDVTRPEVRDDWQSYLIAADQREEAGLVIEARVLRRQGETLRAFGEHFSDFGQVWHTAGPTRIKLPCGCWATCDNAHKIIRVTAFVGRGTHKPRRVTSLHLRKLDLSDPTYLPRRVRELFLPAWLGDVFANHPEEGPA